ncbi:MAG: hypothetical protein LBP32_02550 [Spirochaetaceae bacterium]|nr:hypothetical protein [Spirochaetaceae bacterium]
MPTGDIADDSLLRLSIRDSWFVESPARVLNHRPFRHTLPGGDRVEVRSEVNGDEFMVILAREWPGPGGSYPGWAQGSWVLSRRRDTGAAVRIRIFLRSNFNTYVQFRPLDADRSQMDVVIYDAYMIHALPIPLAFDRLLVLPVEDVLGTADAKFPRRYFDPDAGAYEDIRNFIAGVRKRLPELTFRDDGAIDEEGRYVYINDLSYQEGTVGLNCSGFAKWIVDGILRPVTGTRLPISPLKQPFGERGSSFTEPYEALRDPFFGLDWTRNLASQAASRLRSSGLGTLEEIEVQKSPFASVIIRERGGTSIRSYPSFLPNAGFGFEGIQPLLYTLAIDEPGRLYLASINNELDPAPRMRQHFHIAVLVPYFNQYGIFQVAVFESAGETSFRAFRNRYPGHYINLVRIPVEGPFDP